MFLRFHTYFIMQFCKQHPFHIPVLGLAYTIDSPVKVAPYGISSVISIIEDRLIELMRKHYYSISNIPFQPISQHEPDYRARRITDYLNLVNQLVQTQITKIKGAAFEAGTEIVKYFEMLPDQHLAKQLYRKMMTAENEQERVRLEQILREKVLPGCIDVNIMTKVDGDRYDASGQVIDQGSDAITALRGFVNSNLENASVVFSAGLNPRLFNYLETCTAFHPDAAGQFSKKVIVKVSDYRSALIQGKYLAKKGIWVSEFRIESGLNCGGHAFVSDGTLLGPILQEFKDQKASLQQVLFELYQPVIEQKCAIQLFSAPEISYTVQGGIGTHEEDQFLKSYFEMDGTGWGTPFLLVPEATTVDTPTLERLAKATRNDIELSNNSPLGVRFHYLKGTSSDLEKTKRQEAGRPGSPCTEKHLAFNTEFTEKPICTASRQYQEFKLAELEGKDLPHEAYEIQKKEILDKECLCVGLSNAAAESCGEYMIKNLQAVTICPGPNIVNFSQVVSLQTMTDHIYGRTNILSNPSRPHMFVNELILNIDYLQEQLEADQANQLLIKKRKFYNSFFKNLEEGIQFYQSLPVQDAFQFHQHQESASNRLLELKRVFEMQSEAVPA